jgi:hypothetical protein
VAIRPGYAPRGAGRSRSSVGDAAATAGHGSRISTVAIGTLSYSLGNNWSIVDGLCVAVATLTTSSILDRELTITDPWLKVFTAGYVLVGIGILVELARRLGMGFMTARAELEDAKKSGEESDIGPHRTTTRPERFELDTCRPTARPPASARRSTFREPDDR